MNSETNQVVRILQTGNPRMKWTVRVNLPDGKAVEFQSNNEPLVKWHEDDRCLWLFSGGYSHGPAIMRWPEGAMMITERNEDVKD